MTTTVTKTIISTKKSIDFHICIANSFSVQFKYRACQLFSQFSVPCYSFSCLSTVFLYGSRFGRQLVNNTTFGTNTAKHRFTVVAWWKMLDCWFVRCPYYLQYISKDTAIEKVAKSQTKSAIIFNSHVLYGSVSHSKLFVVRLWRTDNPEKGK